MKTIIKVNSLCPPQIVFSVRHLTEMLQEELNKANNKDAIIKLIRCINLLHNEGITISLDSKWDDSEQKKIEMTWGV